MNTGHCIAAFGGPGFNSSQQPLRQIIHVFKEHVAVAYHNQIMLFKNDTGAAAFTLTPFQAQQPSYLVVSQVIMHGFLMFLVITCMLVKLNQSTSITSTKRSTFFALRVILTLSYRW